MIHQKKPLSAPPLNQVVKAGRQFRDEVPTDMQA
jgi:hypothetical protein